MRTLSTQNSYNMGVVGSLVQVGEPFSWGVTVTDIL